jgi:hypothetical protein
MASLAVKGSELLQGRGRTRFIGLERDKVVTQTTRERFSLSLQIVSVGRIDSAGARS